MMLADFPLFPEAASDVAKYVDGLYLGLVVLTGAVSLLIWLVIFYFAVKYRRRPDNELAQEQEPPAALEMTWTVVPLLIFLVIFVAGSWVYFRLQRVPSNALEVYATGRQWMWKFQHPTGQREINTLHVPVNRPVKITLASEDVIHSLWFPAFRVKNDVLPNRYRTMWFQAIKTGRFHIFCAEYCGTSHSGMIGSVIVMNRPTTSAGWPAAQKGRWPRKAKNSSRNTPATPATSITAPAAVRCWPARTARPARSKAAPASSSTTTTSASRSCVRRPRSPPDSTGHADLPGQVSEEDLIRLMRT
jgi:cytochrome c oxidase subunit II